MGSPIKSPWRKPSEIMRLRQLKSKKRILDKRMEDCGHSVSSAAGGAESTAAYDSLDNQKRKMEESRLNPFRKSPWKRQRRNNVDISPPLLETNEISCDSTLFQLLQNSATSSSLDDMPIEPHLKDDIDRNLSQPDPSVSHVNQYTSTSLTTTGHDNDEQTWHLEMPFDWSLKTALRLISVQPFPWNSGRLTTLEESTGITSFVRCLPLTYNNASPSSLNETGSNPPALDTSPNGQLFQCCQVWMHPALPWLKMFPRHQTRIVGSMTSTPPNAIHLQPQIQESLQADWTESLRSLFHLLRARQCPYFYVCAQLFTVLFRAPGIGANPRMHALITPTTRGFRSALTEEGMTIKPNKARNTHTEKVVKKGVQFTLPLSETESPSVIADELILDETELNGEQDLIDGCEQQAEDVVDWLKSVGVEDKMLAQLDRDPSKINKQKEIDYRPQSLVCVEDGDVHALFNFLLNSKSCVTSSGPFAGIPPTLLAPVAFAGATLRPLKMRQHQAQKTTKSATQETMHVFDLIGPILPHVAHYLDVLMQTRAQQSASTTKFSYNVQFSTVEPSRSFSSYSLPDDGDVPPPVFGQRSLSDCGLAPHVLEAMCSQREGKVLRHVKVTDKGYSWPS